MYKIFLHSYSYKINKIKFKNQKIYLIGIKTVVLSVKVILQQLFRVLLEIPSTYVNSIDNANKCA